MNMFTNWLGRARGCALLLCIVVALSPALMAQRSWRISNFQSNIAVMQDGTMVVTEHINLVFIGEWHGIYRYIPVEYPGPHGSNYTLFLDMRSVTDADGTPLKYESKVDRGYRKLTIHVPGAVNTMRQVNISYSVRNGIRYFDSHDELYWNATGNDWPVPIDNASALVLFPENASGQLRAQAFTGVYGSHDSEASVGVEGRTVNVETTNPLPMRGGLTVDVYIPKGILKEPSGFTKMLWFIQSNPIVLLPFFSFAVMFTMWWYKGRDPQSGLSVAPMYEPPKDMSPAEVGSLIDDSVDPRDVTSTIVDLAVRGFLKIEEHNEKVLFFNNRDYIFHLLKPREEWTGLRDHEREMMRNMFVDDGSTTVRLSSLKNHFYVALPAVKRNILSELKQKGMYNVDPDSANGYRLLGILLIVAPFIIAQVMGWANLFTSAGVAAVSVFLSIVIVWLIGRLMTAKTLKGVRTVVLIAGFKEFMTRVDADRLKRMPPDTFEKFLPYAMSLGVEKHWAQAFEGIVQNPPTWYTGYDPMIGFRPMYFANSMGSLSHSTYEAFATAPRASSTGSGFSGGFGGGGGGFSGGGFGGGGGGAF